tara:strand:- start:533 stop:790 length:258 start_codon:yes stop_codon:yes gene_type:complete
MDRRKKIEQLDKLFIELRNITSERSKERILWHSDGKGINFDNISVLNRKAQNKKDEILALRGLLNRYKEKIPSKYNFTYFIVNVD